MKNIYFRKGDASIWNSPVEQNIRHAIIIEETLKRSPKINFQLPIKPIIVFSNYKISIDNHTDHVVIRANELVPFIESQRRGTAEMSTIEYYQILSVLSAANMYNEKIVRVEKYDENYEKWETYIEESIKCKDMFSMLLKGTDTIHAEDFQ